MSAWTEGDIMRDHADRTRCVDRARRATP
jgi:hypothetical protein